MSLKASLPQQKVGNESVMDQSFSTVLEAQCRGVTPDLCIFQRLEVLRTRGAALKVVLLLEHIVLGALLQVSEPFGQFRELADRSFHIHAMARLLAVAFIQRFNLRRRLRQLARELPVVQTEALARPFEGHTHERKYAVL
ncbi:hypothetical protein PHMEG_0001994 [Phytophthora megakarya]|uniref:Uncharacterized protein n=1 Tax=Phytophthora megakarya TaxID=4795 RepID=A0A225X1N3_9STRA|nr:hypothetical protein PHMEG_0001994 [Phytophthora megakarya]